MTKKYRPNSVMRGYKPEVIRFCWIAQTTDGSYHSGFTWGGIPNLTRRVGKTIETLRMVDLKYNKIYVVIDIESFMDDWADNYANPDWAISKCPYVKKS
jgi:hypothetical protein